MGRDIDFARNEISHHGYHYLETSDHKTYITHNVKSHRTGYHHSSDYYEDYGVLLWMDKDGNLKKRRKKYIDFEEEAYQPKDFLETWEVSIEIGDYCVQAVCNFESMERYVSVSKVKDIIPSLCGYQVMTEDVGIIKKQGDLEITTSEIHDVFDEKFWKGVEKASKIPKFKEVRKVTFNYSA